MAFQVDKTDELAILLSDRLLYHLLGGFSMNKRIIICIALLVTGALVAGLVLGRPKSQSENGIVGNWSTDLAAVFKRFYKDRKINMEDVSSTTKFRSNGTWVSRDRATFFAISGQPTGYKAHYVADSSGTYQFDGRKGTVYCSRDKRVVDGRVVPAKLPIKILLQLESKDKLQVTEIYDNFKLVYTLRRE